MDFQANATDLAERKRRTLETLGSAGVVAVIRTDSTSNAIEASRALATGGVIGLEITFTTPGAADAIATLADDMRKGRVPETLLLGAGTVLTENQAQMAADAGAKFFVSPHTVPAVISFAKQRGFAVMPGALTPAEIHNAHGLGGDIIKVFPAQRMGPAYFRDLKGPYPHIPLMPTGGVSLENIADWLAAGAAAIGVGSELVDKAAVKEGRWHELTDRARRFTQAYHDARRQLGGA